MPPPSKIPKDEITQKAVLKANELKDRKPSQKKKAGRTDENNDTCGCRIF